MRIFLLGASALALVAVDGHSHLLLAQSSSPVEELPPVVVRAPKPKPAVRRVTAPRSDESPAPQVAAPENPRGSFPGYAATRSVSGTKTNTPLNEIPQSISVVGKDQIRDQKPQKFDEIVRYTPGIHGETFGADTRNDWFLIRGFPAQQDGYFLDSLTLFNTAYATWKLQPFGMERVEVLRGPTAALYGGGSPGGIVNAVSKLPPAEPIRYMEVGVNNYGNRYVSFDLGGPLQIAPQDGQLFYRLLGTLKAGDTQVDHTSDDSYFIAPSMTYKPDLDTTFTLLAQASRDKTNGNNWLPYVGTVVPASYGRIPTQLFTSDPSIDTFKRNQAMIGYQFERNITDSVTFRQNARFAHIDVLYNTLLGNAFTGSAPGGLLPRYQFYANDSANQVNVDNQLEVNFRTGVLQHKMLAGVDYKNYRIDDYQAFGFGVPDLNVLNPVYGNIPAVNLGTFYDRVLSQEQVGLYLQDQIKYDRFTLVLSGRNDWVDLKNDNRAGPDQSRSDSKASGRVGLIYNGDFGLSPYVSYATSYNPVIGTNGFTKQLFNPETGQQTEVGVKWEPAGFNGHIDVALFDLKRQNVLTPNPTNATQAIQNGEVTSRGLELSAVANLTREFKMVGSFTAYNIFVSKDADPTLVGTVPTNTPSRLASLWGDYTFREGPLSGFGFSAGVRYVGASFADTANAFPVPAYLLGDAAIHYEYQSWRYALNVSNITDQIFVSSCATIGACYYGDRRRVTASVSYKW